MTSKDIKNVLGERYQKTDDILIEQLINYMTVYAQTWSDIHQGKLYRIPLTARDPATGAPINARYYINQAFTVMLQCANEIRKILDMLGLTKRGQKVELTTKQVDDKSLLEQLNSIDDD